MSDINVNENLVFDPNVKITVNNLQNLDPNLVQTNALTSDNVISVDYSNQDDI